jgi:hypothetical protein
MRQVAGLLFGCVLFGLGVALVVHAFSPPSPAAGPLAEAARVVAFEPEGKGVGVTREAGLDYAAAGDEAVVLADPGPAGEERAVLVRFTSGALAGSAGRVFRSLLRPAAGR